MVSDVLGLYESVEPGHTSKSALESRISNFLAKQYIHIYHIKSAAA